MKIIVDLIEEDEARVELENGDMINIPKVLLDNAKEGDIVEIKVLKEETEKRKNYIQSIASKLFDK